MYFSFRKNFTESSLLRFLAYPYLSIYPTRFLVCVSLKTTGIVISLKMVLPTFFTITSLLSAISYSGVWQDSRVLGWLVTLTKTDEFKHTAVT